MLNSKQIAKQIDETVSKMEEKGIPSADIEEAVANLREMYEKALEEEQKELDRELEAKESEIEASMNEKLEKMLQEKLTSLKEEIKSDDKEVKKVYGYKQDKAIGELEGDEKTATWFKSLIKATVTKDPQEYAVVKALSEGTDADGGHLVPEEFRMELIEDLRNATVMRSAGATVFPMARRTLELPSLGSRPQTSWGSENSTASTTTADFGNLVLTARKIISRLYTSTELAEDSTPEVTSLIRRLFVQALAEAEDKAFFTGSGTDRPKGLTQYTIGSISAGGAVTFDEVIELYASTLGQGYRNDAAWFMNSRTWAHLLTIKDDNSRYQYNAPGNVIVSGAEPRLMGRPVFEQNDLPSSEIYLGAPSFYYIGDRARVSVTTSTEADDTFKNDQIQIKVRSRVDGKLALTNAFKKITNTGVS